MPRCTMTRRDRGACSVVEGSRQARCQRNLFMTAATRPCQWLGPCGFTESLELYPRGNCRDVGGTALVPGANDGSVVGFSG